MIYFDEKNTLFDYQAKDWIDAVKKSGELLEKNGYAKCTYTEKIIDSVKKVGAYIVVAPGIALPHERAEYGALKVGYSLLTLKKPIYFEGSNEAVKILLAFTAVDNESHIDILKGLVSLIENGLVEKLQELSRLTNSEKIKYINNLIGGKGV